MQSSSFPRSCGWLVITLVSALAVFPIGCPFSGTGNGTDEPTGNGDNPPPGQTVPDVVLDITIEGEGTVEQAASGSVVTLTATPDENWEFEQWYGSTESTDNPLTIQATDNTSISARFTQIQPDADGDGVPDDDDACPGFDDSLDADRDGVPDDCDVCPRGNDSDDADEDGVPDFCDPCPNDDPDDSDDDGVCDSDDACPGSDDNDDEDGDGKPDDCDACPDDDENDSDGDGICGNLDDCPDTPAGRVVDDNGCPRPTNDLCADPTTVTDGTRTFSNALALTDGRNEPNCNTVFGTSDGKIEADVWFCYTSLCNGTTTLDLCDSDFDTRMAVYTGCTCPATDLEVCADDECGVGTLRSKVTFDVTDGDSYLIRVGGFNDEQGNGTLSVTCDPGCLLAADCDDGNPCTTNVCNSNRDCELTNNTASCDDGVFCNGTDTCSGGTCSAHSDDPCVGGGECANICDESGNTCNLPTGTPCAAEADEDVCTDDVCNGGLCTHPNNSAPCDDGSFCTATDACSGGVCVGSGNPCPGPDGDNNCAESCDEDAGNCTKDDPEESVCNDGQFCTTTDTCSGGVCIGSADDPCPEPDDTDDNCAESCNEDTDDCTAPDPDGSICDDFLFCTETDTCASGECIGIGSPCPRLCEEPARCFDCFTSLDCDDGVACTNDICNPLAGLCTNFPNSVSCNDNNLCTTDTCDALTGCSSVETVVCGGGEFCNPDTGECEPMLCEMPAECDDGDACTDDTCAPEGVCRSTVVDCDDGLFCTGAEQCDSETGCVLGLEPCEDDGVDCTDDCDEEADECTNTPNDDLCTDDGVFCNGSEMCDPVAGCISPGDPCPPGDTCIESSQACDTQPSTWSSTQTLLPETAYSPPESYELDASRQLTMAHLGLSEANLRLVFPDADITVLATDVLPGQDTLMYRTEQVVGPITRITTQTLTINDFHLSFTRVGEAFVATWAFDYIVADTDNPIFGPDEIRQFAGTQSGDVAEDGSMITWTSVEGTRCTLDQGICNNPVELTETSFPLGMWTRD